MIQVFISWSGERSGALASSIQNWLPKVLQAVHPWVSSASIDAGTRWSPEVAQALQEIQFGIVCLTPENLLAPWILFEAGALSKTVSETRVVPYLLGFEPRELKGPLAQFQAVRADKTGTKSLVQSLNSASDRAITGEALNETFEMWWPKLEVDIGRILSSSGATEAPKPLRSTEDMLGEVLELLRGQRFLAPSEVEVATQNPEIAHGFGERLRRNRLYRGITQAELANRVGISQSYISQLEGGRVLPDNYLLRLLADALEVEVTEFLQSRDIG